MWFGNPHGSCSRSLLRQALIYQKEKRWHEAEQLCYKLLQSLRQTKTSSQRDAFILYTFETLANIYKAQDHHEATLYCYAQAIRHYGTPTPLGIYVHLLYCAGRFAYDYLNTVFHRLPTHQANALQRYVKFCFEEYLRCDNAGMAHVEAYLVNIYLSLGDVMSAFYLSEYNLGKDFFKGCRQPCRNLDMRWLSQAAATDLRFFLLHKLAHQTSEQKFTSPCSIDSSLIKLESPSPLGISRRLLNTLFKRCTNDTLVHNLKIFLETLAQRFQLPPSGNLSKVLRLPVVEGDVPWDDASFSSFLSQFGLHQENSCDSLSTSPVVEEIQQNVLLRLLRSGKDSQKKGVESSTSDVYRKTVTVFNELMASIEKLFAEDANIEVHNPNVSQSSDGPSISWLSNEVSTHTGSFPPLEDYILLIMRERPQLSPSSSSSTVCLGEALLEYCDVLLEGKYYVHTPNPYLNLLMQLIPFVPKENHRRYLHHISAGCYSCFIMEPVPVEILKHLFQRLGDWCDTKVSLFYLIYCLLVSSLRFHHCEGFQTVQRLLKAVELPVDHMLWIESCHDVCEAELLVDENFTWSPVLQPPLVTLTYDIREALQLQYKANTLMSLVWKWFERPSQVIPEPNILNNRVHLKKHLQTLSGLTLKLLESLVPRLCEQHLLKQKTFCGMNDWSESAFHLTDPEQISLVEISLQIIGDVLTLQSLFSKSLQLSFHPGCLTSFLQDSIELCFDTTQYHANTLMAALVPYFSALCHTHRSKNLTKDFESSVRKSFLYHSTFSKTFSIRAFSSSWVHSKQSTESPNVSETNETSSVDSSPVPTPLHKNNDQDHDIVPYSYFEFSSSCSACIKGLVRLLVQDIMTCKVIFLNSRKWSDVHKKSIGSLLSRIRFALQSLTTCLSCPFHLYSTSSSTQPLLSQSLDTTQRSCDSTEHLDHSTAGTLVQFLQHYIGLLKKILELDLVSFLSEWFDGTSDPDISLDFFSLEGKISIFLTPDLFRLPFWVVNLYKEKRSTKASELWSQGTLTYPIGLGTLSIPSHILCLTLDSFSFVKTFLRWIYLAKEQFQVVLNAVYHSKSISLTNTLDGTRLTELPQLLSMFPPTLTGTILESLHFLHWSPQKLSLLSQKHNPIAWETEMFIVELVSISLMRLFGLLTCPHFSPPFDSCRAITHQDYEECILRFCEKTKTLGSQFHMANPLVLCLCIAVYRKLSGWYSESFHRQHLPKTFRLSIADALECYLFLDSLDVTTSCSVIMKDSTLFSFDIPDFPFLAKSISAPSTHPPCQILDSITDPLVFPPLLDLLDQDSSVDTVSRKEGETESDIEDQSEYPRTSEKETGVKPVMMYSTLFDVWKETWDFLDRYTNKNFSSFFSPLAQQYKTLDTQISFLEHLKTGSLLSSTDAQLLFFSATKPLHKSSPYSSSFLSIQNLHSQSALMYFPFHHSVSCALWRPISDSHSYKIFCASLLHMYFLNFLSASSLDIGLLGLFLFHGVLRRPVFSCPTKLRDAVFPSFIWGDRLGIFFKETHTLQPSTTTRRLISYLPSCLLNYGAYSTAGLEINHLLSNLMNINKTTALGCFNLKVIGCTAYTHRHIFYFLSDRILAEKRWEVVFPLDEMENGMYWSLKFSNETSSPLYYEIPIRQGIQALFTLQLEQQLLGYCVYLSLQRTFDAHHQGLTPDTPHSMEITQQSRSPSPGEAASSSFNPHTHSTTSTLKNLAIRLDLYRLNIQDQSHPLHQQDYMFQNVLPGSFVNHQTLFHQETSNHVPKDQWDQRTHLVNHVVDPFIGVRCLYFFDHFVLYGRCRVEHLLVHFSLCKLVYPCKSGVFFYYLMRLKKNRFRFSQLSQLEQTVNHHTKDIGRDKENKDHPLTHQVFTQQIQRLCEEAHEIDQQNRRVVNYLKPRLDSAAMSSERLSTQQTQDSRLSCMLSPHTLKLFRSFMWIPSMILARSCLLLMKLDLSNRQDCQAPPLKHCILFLKCIIFLSRSLHWLMDEHYDLPKGMTNSNKQHPGHPFPTQFSSLAFYELPPLIKLVTLRLHLFILGFFLNHTPQDPPATAQHLKSEPPPSRFSTPTPTGSSTRPVDQFNTKNGSPSRYLTATPFQEESSPLDPSFSSPSSHKEKFTSFPSEDPIIVDVSCDQHEDGNALVNFSQVSSENQQHLSHSPSNTAVVHSSSFDCNSRKTDLLNMTSQPGSGEDPSVVQDPNLSQLLGHQDVASPTFSPLDSTPHHESPSTSESFQLKSSLLFLLCTLCRWDQPLMTLTECDVVERLCCHYEQDFLNTCENRDEDEKVTRMFYSQLLHLFPHPMSPRELQEDCLKSLEAIVSRFGRSYGKLYLVLSRYYLFCESPCYVVQSLHGLLCKGLNSNHMLETKSNLSGMAKQADTVFLLYQQIFTYRIRHEDKMKYSLIWLLLSALEQFFQPDVEDKTKNTCENQVLENDQSYRQPHTTDGSLTLEPDALDPFITVDLPYGLVSARIVSWCLPFPNPQPKSLSNSLQRRWKILPESLSESSTDSHEKDMFLFALTYLVDFLQQQIKIVKKQHVLSQNTNCLQNVSNDSKGFSQLACQTISTGLFILAQKIARSISTHHLLVPWEFHDTPDVDKRSSSLSFVTPSIVRQFISALSLLPNDHEDMKKNFLSFLNRMVNVFMIQDIDPSSFPLCDLHSIPENQPINVIAECQLKCGMSRLALNVIRENSTFRFLKSLFPHHVMEHHPLHQIFKTVFLGIKSETKRRQVLCKSDRSAKKTKSTH